MATGIRIFLQQSIGMLLLLLFSGRFLCEYDSEIQILVRCQKIFFIRAKLTQASCAEMVLGSFVFLLV